ncbi:MAG: hypothetical protein D6729_04645 [Deltaproteobacteria bacterium]|nr:MAG: hypothetical protein D6729_04645 [Deltaproteobacteria bacterium]
MAVRGRRRRRGAGLVILLAGVGGGLFLLSRGAPLERTLVYDLGEGHETITGLSITVRYDGGVLYRQDRWTFAAGEAPRRLSVPTRLPDAPCTLEWRIDRAAGGGEAGQRALDPRGPFDRIVLHLLP